MARNDIHRPSAIIPADYEFVGIEYQRIEGLGAIYEVQMNRQIIQAHMSRTGGTYSGHTHGGNCHVCGAHCIYTALFYHAATNSYIRTGMDCAAKLDMGDERRFRAFRDAIEAARLAKAGKKKAEGVLREAGLANAWELYLLVTDLPHAIGIMGFQADTPLCILADFAEEMELEVALILRAMSLTPEEKQWEERTVADIVSKLVQYGSLSAKQMSFLGVLLRKIEERPQRQAKIAAEKAAAQDVPEGRHTLAVEVIKTDWRETAYGSTLKMLCKAIEGGFTLWGTVPSALQTIDTPEGNRPIQRGDKLNLTATLERSEKDTKFGFFKRPIAKLV